MPIRLGKEQFYSPDLTFDSRTGLVESNIRKLVSDLERSEYILIAHIRPERIELPPNPEGHSPRYISRWFLGLSFNRTDVQVSFFFW